MESGLTRNKIITELSRSAHGELKEYIPVAQAATRQEPEFMAHLISWDRTNGQIRDAKVALPIVSLAVPEFPAELVENSLAHLTLLNPRELLKAYHFALDLKLPNRMRLMRRLIEAYLRSKESNAPRFERLALTHRQVLKSLYRLVRIKPADAVRPFLGSRAEGVKSGPPVPYPHGSLFEAVAQLKDMSLVEAAGTIMERKIPFLVAMGALGKRAKEPDLLLALLERMTPNEVINNTKMLEKAGVKSNPALRGAFDAALARASDSTSNLLKATTAAEAVEDEELKEKLRGVQEKQIQKLGGIEGNWLVLGDRSGSMKISIEIAKEVAGTLAKMVKGKVWLVFFDTTPQTIDVTGMALDAIKNATRFINPGGGTSIGCGLQRMLDEKQEVDGIAVVSDAAENSAPLFTNVYRKYCETFGKQIPVYLYRTFGGVSYSDRDLAASMKSEGFDLQEFDLRGSKVDYYSLGNTVATMRASRYSLVDEIMESRLLKLSETFNGVNAVAVTA